MLFVSLWSWAFFLWRLNTLLAWLVAWALVFLIPAFSSAALDRFQFAGPVWISSLALSFQFVLAGACWFLLERDIKLRRFGAADVI